MFKLVFVVALACLFAGAMAVPCDGDIDCVGVEIDGNPCTRAACVFDATEGGTCVDGTVGHNGEYCSTTSTNICVNGACSEGCPGPNGLIRDECLSYYVGNGDVCTAIIREDRENRPCDDGNVCTSDQCRSGVCTPVANVPALCAGTGTICNPTVICVDGSCPWDGTYPGSETQCRGSFGECDKVDFCNGRGGCPDTKWGPERQCRAAGDPECDPNPEFCSGSSNTCPANSDGRSGPCGTGSSGDGGFCDPFGSCLPNAFGTYLCSDLGPKSSTTLCDGDPNAPCDGVAYCPGTAGGSCPGAEPVDCSDAYDCTIDSCVDGVCQHIRSNAYCANNLPAGYNSQCVDTAVCVADIVPGSGPSGCQWTLAPAGSPCETDSFSCTSQTCSGSGARCGNTVFNSDVCVDLYGSSGGDCGAPTCVGATNPNSDADGCILAYTPGAECRPSTDGDDCDPAEFCVDGSFDCPPNTPTRNGDSCGTDPGATCNFQECLDNVCKTFQDDQVCFDKIGGQNNKPCGSIECLPSSPQADEDGCVSTFTPNQICAQPTDPQCDLPDKCVSGNFDCPPSNPTALNGQPCIDADGNDCTRGKCMNNLCAPQALPDYTECTDGCGEDARCVDVECLCQCSVNCTLTRGGMKTNSPGAPGKPRNDPVWQTDFFQNTQICGQSVNDWINSKNNIALPTGCENDLIAQYLTAKYNMIRYELSTGESCDGIAIGDPQDQFANPACDAAADAAYIFVRDLLKNNLTTIPQCQTVSVDDCANKVEALRRFNEGECTVDECKSSLPITPVAVSSQQNGGSPGSEGGSGDDDHLGAGGIIAIVFGSLVGLIIIGLFVFIMFAAWGNIMANDKKSKGYRRQRSQEDPNESL